VNFENQFNLIWAGFPVHFFLFTILGSIFMCGLSAALLRSESGALAIALAISEKLEHRGYDAAGVAVLLKGLFEIFTVGLQPDSHPVAKLREMTETLESVLVMGHTRQRTVGDSSEKNAHPFRHGKVVGCGNGDITNHSLLDIDRSALTSDVDTERGIALIAQLYECEMEGLEGLAKAVKNALPILEGNFALALVADGVEGIVLARHGHNALYVGELPDELGFVVGSTRDSLVPHTGRMAKLPQGVFCMTHQGVTSEVPVEFSTYADLTPVTGIGQYATTMEGEIHQQLEITERLLNNPFSCPLFNFKDAVIVGCGSSEIVAQLGWWFFTEAGIQTQVFNASEFVGAPKLPLPPQGAAFFAISQSGVTAHVLEAAALAKDLGYYIVAVTNTLGSPLADMANFVTYLQCGHEEAVASTKVVSATAITFQKLADCFGKRTSSFENLPSLMRSLLSDEMKTQCDRVARALLHAPSAAFIGTGDQLPAALEAVLKYQELTRRSAWGNATNNFKHGPIGVVAGSETIQFPVIVCAVGTKNRVPYDEITARNGLLVGIIDRDNPHVGAFDLTILTPTCDTPLERYLAALVPCQLLTLRITEMLRLPVDRIEGLAKALST
jgi:glutamine---fructose-6-phosphate transaminase (isomerizing)